MIENNVFQNIGFDTVEDEELTIIGSSTIIEGDGKSSITCGGNLDIKGRVNGDVNVGGATVVTGVVDGNISTVEMVVTSAAKITGNVNCKNSLNVNDGSVLTGDVKAKTTYVAANVNGNIDSASEVKIASEGVVNGNITTGSISVESGAVINGNLAIKKN